MNFLINYFTNFLSSQAVPKNPYYFWAVMSTVLQALDSDETTCNKLLLPLAERMISKMEADGKMEQEQETHLYIMVLELQVSGFWFI